MWLADSLSDRNYAFDLSTGERKPDSDYETPPPVRTRPRLFLGWYGVCSYGTTVWMLDNENRKIFAFDLSTGERKPDSDFSSLDPANAEPIGLYCDETTMWVTNDYLIHGVFAYDLATGDRTPQKDIFFPLLEVHHYVNGRPGGPLINGMPLGLWADDETMWVSDLWDGKIYAYDLDTGVATPDLDFNNLAAQEIHPIDIWSDGTTMWATAHTKNRVFAFHMP